MGHAVLPVHEAPSSQALITLEMTKLLVWDMPESSSTYLQTVEEDRCQAQPAVQAVHVGDLGAVVEVEHCHQRHDKEGHGQKVQTGVDQLHHQFAAAPAPGEAVNHDGCRERGSELGALETDVHYFIHLMFIGPAVCVFEPHVNSILQMTRGLNPRVLML